MLNSGIKVEVLIRGGREGVCMRRVNVLFCAFGEGLVLMIFYLCNDFVDAFVVGQAWLVLLSIDEL